MAERNLGQMSLVDRLVGETAGECVFGSGVWSVGLGGG